MASWAEYARAATGAVLQRHPGVAAAVFPNEPERGVYNNALLARGLAESQRADAIEAIAASTTWAPCIGLAGGDWPPR